MNHAPGDVYKRQESLLWQEDLHHPAAVLGKQEGFITNRKAA